MSYRHRVRPPKAFIGRPGRKLASPREKCSPVPSDFRADMPHSSRQALPQIANQRGLVQKPESEEDPMNLLSTGRTEALLRNVLAQSGTSWRHCPILTSLDSAGRPPWDQRHHVVNPTFDNERPYEPRIRLVPIRLNTSKSPMSMKCESAMSVTYHQGFSPRSKVNEDHERHMEKSPSIERFTPQPPTLPPANTSANFKPAKARRFKLPLGESASSTHQPMKIQSNQPKEKPKVLPSLAPIETSPSRIVSKESTKQAPEDPAVRNKSKERTKQALKDPASRIESKESTKQALEDPAVRNTSKESTQQAPEEPEVRNASKESTKQAQADLAFGMHDGYAAYPVESRQSTKQASEGLESRKQSKESLKEAPENPAIHKERPEVAPMASTAKSSASTETKDKAKRGLLTGLHDGTLEKIASSMPPEKLAPAEEPTTESIESTNQAPEDPAVRNTSKESTKHAPEDPPVSKESAEEAPEDAAARKIIHMASTASADAPTETKAKAQKEFLKGLQDGTLEKIVFSTRSAFRAIDRSGDGKIQMAELAQVLASGSGETMGADAVEKLMKEVDTNGDGEIDFDEFMAMMQRKPTNDVQGVTEKLATVYNLGQVSEELATVEEPFTESKEHASVEITTQAKQQSSNEVSEELAPEERKEVEVSEEALDKARNKAKRGLLTGLRDGTLEKIASSMPPGRLAPGEKLSPETSKETNPESESPSSKETKTEAPQKSALKQAEVEAKAKAEAKVEAKAKAEPKAEPKVEAKAKAEPKAEPKVEAKAKAETDVVEKGPAFHALEDKVHALEEDTLVFSCTTRTKQVLEAPPNGSKRPAYYEVLRVPFTDEEKIVLNGFIELHDADDSGSMSLSELKLIVDDIGRAPLEGSKDAEHFEQLMNKADEDESGELNIEEFYVFLAEYYQSVYQRYFTEYDADRSGTISKNELKTVMNRLREEGFKVRSDDLADLFEKVDENCDNVLQWHEFCNFMSGYRRLEYQLLKDSAGFREDELEYLQTVFRKADADRSGQLGIKEVVTLLEQIMRSKVETQESLDQIITLITRIDKDKTMTLDFSEFLRLLRVWSGSGASGKQGGRKTILKGLKDVDNGPPQRDAEPHKSSPERILRNRAKTSMLGSGLVDDEKTEKQLEKSIDELRMVAIQQDVENGIIMKQYGLSNDEVRCLRDSFAFCDADGSGLIDRDELNIILKNLGNSTITSAQKRALSQVLESEEFSSELDFPFLMKFLVAYHEACVDEIIRIMKGDGEEEGIPVDKLVQALYQIGQYLNRNGAMALLTRVGGDPECTIVDRSTFSKMINVDRRDKLFAWNETCGFNETQLKAIKDAFESQGDTENEDDTEKRIMARDGRVLQALKRLDLEPPPEKREKLVHALLRVDRVGEGTLTFTDFLLLVRHLENEKLYARTQEEKEKAKVAGLDAEGLQQFKQVFKDCEPNDFGKVRIPVIQKLFADLGMVQTSRQRRQLQDVINEVTGNDNSGLEFLQFLDVLHRLENIL